MGCLRLILRVRMVVDYIRGHEISNIAMKFFTEMKMFAKPIFPFHMGPRYRRVF